MKKLLLTIAVATIGLTDSKAQSSLELATFEGVIVGTTELIAHELTHTIQQGAAKRYLVQDIATGEIFESLPTQALLAPGITVAYKHVVEAGNGSNKVEVQEGKKGLNAVNVKLA